MGDGEGRAALWKQGENPGECHASSELPYSADESAIKHLLNCLEQRYGSLDAVIQRDDAHLNALRQIDQITGSILRST